MEKKRKLKKRYDSTVEFYDERYEEIQSRKFRAVRDQFNDTSRLLEVSCGTGFLLEKFSKFVDEFFAVDFSFNMLKKAKERSGKAFLVCADADKLPFRNQSFDTVVSLTLLQNMPDPAFTLSEMSRVVRESGKVIATVLEKKCSLEEIKNWMVSVNLKPLKLEKIPNSEDFLAIGKRKS